MLAQTRKRDNRQKDRKCRPKRDFLKSRGLSEKPLTRREFHAMTRLIEKEADRLDKESYALLRVAEWELRCLKGTLQRIEQSN